MILLKVIFSENSEKQLDKMDSATRARFIKHVEKISQNMPKKHLKFGLPFNVENITKQARMVLEIEEDSITVLGCFATHKEYEKWYKSYK